MYVAPEGLADWVSRLVQIPSVNPLHAGPNCGEPGELALATALANWFDKLGAADVTLHDVIDGRPNVYGRFTGRSDRIVVLDVHTDTVTVENMTDPPFDGRIEDGRVWGRGALDTKASLGVICALLETWQKAGLRPEPTLLVVGSVGEEAGGLAGAWGFRSWAEAQGIVPDEIIIAEPTSCAPVHAHKGGLGLRITTVGRSAHTAVPEQGENAITAMAHVLLALDEHHRHLVAGGGTTELGSGTLTCTIIEGGTAQNVVPGSCTVHVGRRITAGEDPAVEYERIVSIARAASPSPIEAEVIRHLDFIPDIGSPAFYQPADTPFVQRLAAFAGTTPTVAPFGTNALRYGGLSGAMAVFGPGDIAGAHRETESVEIADLEMTARAFTGWLNPA